MNCVGLLPLLSGVKIKRSQSGRDMGPLKWVGNTSLSSSASSRPPTWCLELPTAICCHVKCFPRHQLHPKLSRGKKKMTKQATLRDPLSDTCLPTMKEWMTDLIDTNPGWVQGTGKGSPAINFWKAAPCLLGAGCFHLPGAGAQQLLWLDLSQSGCCH